MDIKNENLKSLSQLAKQNMIDLGLDDNTYWTEVLTKQGINLDKKITAYVVGLAELNQDIIRKELMKLGDNQAVTNAMLLTAIINNNDIFENLLVKYTSTNGDESAYESVLKAVNRTRSTFNKLNELSSIITTSQYAKFTADTESVAVLSSMQAMKQPMSEASDASGASNASDAKTATKAN